LHFVAGSISVTEIHGNRTKVRCVDCGARWPWDEFVALAIAREENRPPTSSADDRKAELAPGVFIEMPPWCPQCRGIIKSDTVMFAEPIPQQALAECHAQAELADCALIAGTSATVYPAALFPELVLRRGGVVIDVNTDETPFTPYAVASLRGPAGELLPLLVERVAARLDPRP
jgi:NAD-dependent deacetylase